VSEGVILSGRAPGRSPEQPSGHFTTKLPCKGMTRSLCKPLQAIIIIIVMMARK
jgi:hypothetical protein